jgi:hypothetical protein
VLKCGQNKIACIPPHPQAQETNIPNIAHVTKKEACTSKRALKQTQKTKHNAAFTQSCGSLKNPHTEKKKEN